MCARAHDRMCVFEIVCISVCVYVRACARALARTCVCVAVYVCGDDGDSIS